MTLSGSKTARQAGEQTRTSLTVHRYERNVNPSIGKIGVCLFCSAQFNHPNHIGAQNQPCIGGCGKVRAVTCSDSPVDWLCHECFTARRAKLAASAHYIGGSGEHGCLYDSCGVYRTLQDAVDGLADTFNLGRTRKASLKRYRSLDLNSGRDGAEYCEIVECGCKEPWTHDEQMREEDWNL